MNYRKIYINLIKKAKLENRCKHNGIYYEKHHIFPKCIFPQYISNKHNFILLTPREHFIAHILCYKIWPCQKTACAMWIFLSLNNTYTSKISSRTYEIIRNEYHCAVFDDKRRKQQSEISYNMWKNRTEEEKEKIKNKLKQIANNPEIKNKKSIGIKNTYKTNSEYYETICNTLRNNIDKNKDNPEWREKIRNSNKITWSNPNKLEEHSILAREKYKEKRETGWNPWETRYKPIRCVNNGMIFKTIVDAKKWAKKASKIIEVLHGTRKTAGRDPITNEKLKWEYVENKDN